MNKLAVNTAPAATKCPDDFTVKVSDGEKVLADALVWVERGEKYMEISHGVFRTEAAFRAVLKYLTDNYAGWRIDFVFDPGDKTNEFLRKSGAELFPAETLFTFVSDPPQKYPDRTARLIQAEEHGAFCNLRSDTDDFWKNSMVLTSDLFSVFVTTDNLTITGFAVVKKSDGEVYDIEGSREEKAALLNLAYKTCGACFLFDDGENEELLISLGAQAGEKIRLGRFLA